MYSVELDIRITRRQRLNTVRDDDGLLVYTATFPSDVFAWIWERGAHELRLDARDKDGTLNSYYLHFEKLPVTSDKAA